MFTFLPKKSAAYFTLLVSMLLISSSLQAVTSKDVEKSLRKADYEVTSVRKDEDRVREIEEKLEMAKTDVDEKRQRLEIISASVPPNPTNLQRAEGSLRKATNKVVKLKKKLEEAKAEVEASKKDAEQSRLAATELTSQREYEEAKKEVDETAMMLEDYQNKVDELEIEERQLRAEAQAKSQVAAMKGGGNRWNRLSSSLDEKRAENRVEQLHIYREKVIETQEKLEALMERFKETEIEYARFRNVQE